MGLYNWTSEQLKAIETKGRRLLVSAAAGSGKTAVLVERIIRRIMDENDPVSVDRLLVVTFTKAAASEMKEKIRKRLEEAADNPVIKEQIAILDSANIQTIDSFCMSVVRDHTDELNIDPNVRVAEDAELTLLRADVMEEMLEDYYEKADDKFISFVEAFAQGTAGKGIEDKILDVYKFAQVTVDPDKWYEDQLKDEDTEKYTDYICKNVRAIIASYSDALDYAISLCNQDGGPKSYIKSLTEDLEFVEDVSRVDTYEQLCIILREHKFPAIGRKAKTDSDELVQAVKDIRNEVTKEVKNWTDAYTVESADELAEEREKVRPYLEMIIELARDFAARYKEAKLEKGIIDFNDLEHMALEALSGKHSATGDGAGDTSGISCAEEYKEKFIEIYVDEYQDTNPLQEEIIRSMDNGQVFMVGDVKQSIYKFRQARPEIFMGKYESFSDIDSSSEGTDTVIKLAQNFRSRSEVLESVNKLFRAIMIKELGGVSYTKDVELNPGADFGDRCGEQTEILIADTGNQSAEDNAHETEAKMIAAKIKEITDPETGMQLWDGEKKEYYTARNKDIVILLRSANGVGDIYLNALLDAGVPAHCDTNKGYFDSLEVRTMTAMLTAIDNPRKEIELAAFLHSPIIEMTDDDLVAWRKDETRLSELGKYKLNRGLKMLTEYRSMSKYMSIVELITKIYDETGYYEYASTLPAGKVRKANLDKLLQMASEYASTGYKGLFNFIRYIENLKTYDTDFGEASAVGEKDDVVRIMSIHKSKGLEFPVCFLANAEKKINQTDSNQPILVDDDLGIACQYVNTQERYRESTVKQMALRLKLRNDTLGEELRVLYVALTRAKEKLYITGTTQDEEKLKRKYNAAPKHGGPIAFSRLRNDSGYLYWILESGVRYPMEVMEPGKGISDRRFASEESIRKYLDSLTVDPAVRDEYDGLFNFDYKNKADIDLATKVSISELKKKWMEENSEVPEAQEFISHAGSGGAERGTRYHEVMQRIDFMEPDYDNLPEEVRRSDIEKFNNSEIGNSFKTAQADGTLFRERQFIMGVPARELGVADSDEPVLVQGIIDAFIDDGENLILLDYKTDRVSSEKELIDRYAGQLHYYAMALEKMRNRKVTRKIIWSFALEKEIDL